MFLNKPVRIKSVILIVVLSMLISNGSVFGASKSKSKTTAPAKKVEKAEYIKSDVKAVDIYFSIKSRGISAMRTLSIGDSWYLPADGGKITIDRARVSSLDKNENVYDFSYTNIQDSSKSFNGSVNDKYSRYILNDGMTIEVSSAHPCFSFDFSAKGNSLFEGKNKETWLFRDGALYESITDTMDYWSKRIGDISAYAFDPSNDKIIYSFSSKGSVRKSMDSGSNWLDINNGIPGGINIYDIVVNPGKANDVYLLTSSGLLKTDDAGMTWGTTKISWHVLQFIINPKNPNIFYSLTTNGLYTSNDSGASWKRIDTNLPKIVVKSKGRTAEYMPAPIYFIALSSNENPELIAVTYEKGILKSSDNGSTWNDFNAGYNIKDGAYSVLTTNDGIYIGSFRCIYHSKNSGAWTKIDLTNKGGKEQLTDIRGMRKLDGDKGFIVTDGYGKIAQIGSDNILTGLNYGVLAHTKILGLKSDQRNNENRLYAFVENINYTDIDIYGLYCSTDNGLTWDKMLIYDKPFYTNPRIIVSPINPKKIFIIEAGSSTLNYESYSGGEYWTSFQLSLKYLNDWIMAFKMDPMNENILYAINGVNEYTLFKFKYNPSSSGATNWISLNIDASDIEINIKDNNKIITDNLKLTEDGGWTWRDLKVVANGNEYKGADPLYFNGNEILLWAGSSLLSSNDMGATWKEKKIERDSARIISYDPYNPDTIFIAYKIDDKTLGIIESNDRGENWHPIAKFHTNEIDQRIYAVVRNENQARVINIGTEGGSGLFKSSDDGRNWDIVGGVKSPSTLNNYSLQPAVNNVMLQPSKEIIQEHMLEKPEVSCFIDRPQKPGMTTLETQNISCDVSIEVSDKGLVDKIEKIEPIDFELAFATLNVGSFSDAEKQSVYKKLEEFVKSMKFKPFSMEGVDVKAKGDITVNLIIQIPVEPDPRGERG